MWAILMSGLVAYLLGCLSAGYYLAQARGLDLRTEGSGSTGARNAGRLLGTGAFTLTFFLDLAKGALAVLAAGWIAPGPWGRPVALLAVVVGHIWPAQLRFQGGRGISPAVGGILALSWHMTILLAIPLLLGWAGARSFRRGGMLAVAAGPPLAWWLRDRLGLTYQDAAAITLLACLLVATHLAASRVSIAPPKKGGDRTIPPLEATSP